MKNIHAPTARLLQQKTAALTARFLKGRAPDFLTLHARLLDEYFQQAFESSRVGPRMGIDKNPYAIIALGGYGRQEQCVRSDIDLLFLFEKKVPAAADHLIQEMVYPLWDIGLEVGYATRSLRECVKLGGRDFEVLAPLLDARFICGMSRLYSALTADLREKIILRQPRRIVQWLVEKNAARHRRFGDSAYLLEPNLKEGRGGLRDYHTMLWIARIEFNLKQPRDLLYLGLLSHDEFQALTRCLAFIWNVRNRLHHLCGRKCDRLHFEYQVGLARDLKFRRSQDHQPVERFLGELHGRMEFLKQQHLMLLYELGLLARSPAGRSKSAARKKIDGLEVSGARALNFTGAEKIIKSPELLIRIFEESSRLNIPLSAEARRLVKEFSHLATKNFRISRSVVRSFERILTAPMPTFNVLNEMLTTGLLVRFIPEFGRIVNRIQYDEYHLYPVDRHLLRTVQTLKSMGAIQDDGLDPLCKELYQELKDKKILLWAALLHDIGKADPRGSHSKTGALIVKRILREKGLSQRDVATATFLVAEHLLLIKTATRRDIHNEETALACARKIGHGVRLKMLYLLTVADSVATGPQAWNDWTAALLRDFFLKVLNILEKGELASRQAVVTVARKKAALLRSAPTPEAARQLESLFAVMSPRYLLAMPAAQIAAHIQLYRQLAAGDFIWQIDRPARGDSRHVTICARDSSGLISKIAGVFTLNNIDILNVQVFTWRNGIALDIFDVKPPPDQILETEKWRRTEAHLKSALGGELDLAAALKRKVSVLRRAKPGLSKRPHRVIVDNSDSSFFTIVEVFTYNFTGLLFSITDALYHCGLDIRIAKIATKVDQVVDIFYVRDFNGQKVDSPRQEASIKESILARLPGAKRTARCGPTSLHDGSAVAGGRRMTAETKSTVRGVKSA